MLFQNFGDTYSINDKIHFSKNINNNQWIRKSVNDSRFKPIVKAYQEIHPESQNFQNNESVYSRGSTMSTGAVICPINKQIVQQNYMNQTLQEFRSKSILGYIPKIQNQTQNFFRVRNDQINNGTNQTFQKNRLDTAPIFKNLRVNTHSQIKESSYLQQIDAYEITLQSSPDKLVYDRKLARFRKNNVQKKYLTSFNISKDKKPLEVIKVGQNFQTDISNIKNRPKIEQNFMNYRSYQNEDSNYSSPRDNYIWRQQNDNTSIAQKFSGEVSSSTGFEKVMSNRVGISGYSSTNCSQNFFKIRNEGINEAS